MIASLCPIQHTSTCPSESINSTSLPCHKKAILDYPSIVPDEPLSDAVMNRKKTVVLLSPQARLRWRTFESTHAPSIRTEIGRSCRRVRSREQAGRQGWGLSTSSRYSAALKRISFLQLQYHRATHPLRWSKQGSTGLAECPSKCCRWS